MLVFPIFVISMDFPNFDGCGPRVPKSDVRGLKINAKLTDIHNLRNWKSADILYVIFNQLA
jgi:hypothetical protein